MTYFIVTNNRRVYYLKKTFLIPKITFTMITNILRLPMMYKYIDCMVLQLHLILFSKIKFFFFKYFLSLVNIFLNIHLKKRK